MGVGSMKADFKKMARIGSFRYTFYRATSVGRNTGKIIQDMITSRNVRVRICIRVSVTVSQRLCLTGPPDSNVNPCTRAASRLPSSGRTRQ